MRRVLVIGLLVLGMAAALDRPGVAQEAELPDIEDEVMCPICGTTLELSQSPQAERERELIRRLIAEGKDKEEIKDVLVAEYGPEVLAIPESSGFDLTALVAPVVGLVLAGGAVLILARRRIKPPVEPGEPHDREAARLREDMRRYDF